MNRRKTSGGGRSSRSKVCGARSTPPDFQRNNGIVLKQYSIFCVSRHHRDKYINYAIKRISFPFVARTFRIRFTRIILLYDI